jgi:hypothetical protein
MTTYAIVFKGELREGFTQEAVMAAFQARGNLSAQQIAQVFSGKKVTLKKGLSREEAKRFAHELRAIGMRVIAVAPPAPEVPADPGSTPYNILFAGEVVEGFSREAVMLMAAAKLKFSDAQRDLLFSGKDVTMKRNLGEEKARNYLDTLRKLGMRARVDPPLPALEAPELDPAVEAAEASLVETQLAQPVYNYEETFHSSSTLEMARDAQQEPAMDGIHPSLLATPEPPKPAPRPVSEPTLLPIDANEHVATVVNDDIVRAYEAELSAPDLDVDALRKAHDPVAPADPVHLDFTRAQSSPAKPEPTPVATPEPVAAPTSAAPETVADMSADDDPDEAPEEAPEEAQSASSGLSTRTAVGLAVLVAALIVVWVLI